MLFLVAPRPQNTCQPLHVSRKNLFSPDFSCRGGNRERSKKGVEIHWSGEQIGQDRDLTTGRMQLPSSVGSAVPLSKGSHRRPNDLGPLRILPGPERLASILHFHCHDAECLTAHVWV